MKIFIVIDYWFPYVGGGPVHVAQIANRLCRLHDTTVTVVTSRLYPSLNRKKNPFSIYFDVVHLGPSMPFSSITGRLLFLKELFFFLLKSDFDVVHVHPFTPVVLVKIISLLKRKPIVFTVHAMGNDVLLKNNNRTISYIFRIVDKVQTYMTAYSYEIFVDETLMNKKNINRNTAYIPNGVDIKSFAKIDVKKKKEYRILFVGRFHNQKNILSLLEAFNLVHKKINSSILTLVGEGELHSLISKKIIDLGLRKNVSIKKPMFGDSLVREYKSSDLFVLPSLYEGFPLTLLEAWAAQIAVAATPVGMVGKILNKKNGYIIPDGSPRSIADTLLSVIEDPKRKEKISTGLELVKNKYSWERTAKETYTIYKKICRQ